jgi:hypothetical protein
MGRRDPCPPKRAERGQPWIENYGRVTSQPTAWRSNSRICLAPVEGCVLNPGWIHATKIKCSELAIDVTPLLGTRPKILSHLLALLERFSLTHLSQAHPSDPAWALRERSHAMVGKMPSAYTLYCLPSSLFMSDSTVFMSLMSMISRSFLRIQHGR